MKKSVFSMIKLFGIIALAVIMASAFAACKEDEPDDTFPVKDFPEKYNNTHWEHKKADGSGCDYRITFQERHFVIVEDIHHNSERYMCYKIEEQEDTTVFYFCQMIDGKDKDVGLITIKNGEIHGVILPILGSKSGGWSKEY